MNYLRKRYKRIILFVLIVFIGFAYILHDSGTGYRPSITGGSGPLSWSEIFRSLPKIFLTLLIVIIPFIYFDYWDFKKKNEEK